MKFNEYFIIFCVAIDGRKIYDAMHEFVQTREQAEEEVREYYKRMNYPCEVFGAFTHPEVMAILANRPDWMNGEAEKEIRERMKDFPEPQEYAFNTPEGKAMKVNFIKLHEVEIQRQNVTPRQFWSYCKREIERRTGGALHLSDWLDDFNDWETPACESEYHRIDHEEWGEDARTEVIRYEPFGCQWYLQGSYNFIMEFDFYDEKTGFGYLYMCDMEEVPTEPEEPTETEQEQPETEPETATTNEEESRMENVLYYEERGCFHDEMRYEGVSDMQNFRIFCEFEGKDGKHIFAEFGGYDREPKNINGKKAPGFKNRLHASLSYEDERGCWGFTPAAPYMGIDAAKYNYTREDVLRFINAVSAEHFTAIQPRLILDCKNHYQNFTGSGLMVHIMQDWKKRWAKREDIAREYEVLNCFGSTFLRIRGQVYEYAGIEAEKQNPENAPGYNDYKVRFDRITDTERAEKIKAQGIETIGILTA